MKRFFVILGALLLPFQTNAQMTSSDCDLVKEMADGYVMIVLTDLKAAKKQTDNDAAYQSWIAAAENVKIANAYTQIFNEYC